MTTEADASVLGVLDCVALSNRSSDCLGSHRKTLRGGRSGVRSQVQKACGTPERHAWHSFAAARLSGCIGVASRDLGSDLLHKLA